MELFPASEEFEVEVVRDSEAGAEQLNVFVGEENESERRLKISPRASSMVNALVVRIPS